MTSSRRNGYEGKQRYEMNHEPCCLVLKLARATYVSCTEICDSKSVRVRVWLPSHFQNHDQRRKPNMMCYLTAKYSLNGKHNAAAGLYFCLSTSPLLFLSFVAVCLCVCTSVRTCPRVFMFACLSVHMTRELARLGTLTTLALSTSDHTQTTTNTHTREYGQIARE